MANDGSIITTARLGAGSVTRAKLAAGAVATAKIAASAVTTEKVANSAITTDKLASTSVSTAKIASGAVTTDKLDASAVSTAKIASAAVTTAKMATAAKTILPSLSAAAEASNARDVTITMKDTDSTTIAEVVRLHCQVLKADMTLEVTANWTLAIQGTGTEVSTTAKAGLLIDTASSGIAIVRISDVSTTFSGTVYLKVETVNRIGTAAIIALAFT